MKVLIACEFSGIVRDAFAARGHDAWSCDLLPTERPGNHIQGDVLELLTVHSFDLMIAFPPCTYLCSSGLHWNNRRPEREQKTLDALVFVHTLLTSPVRKIALENPVGRISTAIRPPDQKIQPYRFGEDASKLTCLWLHGLPPLRPTKDVEPRIVNGKARWANQTDSGQNKLAPSKTRSMERSRTYPGIANAMADQWGGDLTEIPTNA